MTILHYTLGLPPQRSGGLTKYATDLILEQQNSLDIVLLLYPSGYKWWSRKISFSKSNIKSGICSVRLKNTPPVPLLYGIKSPKDFISKRLLSESEMERFYSEVKPDVFHVHTLMWLPKELLHFLKAKGVKLIFTTHDYFGICPKVNLIDCNSDVCSGISPQKCAKCNINAKSTLYLRLRNSKLALKLKNIAFLKNILCR